MNNRVSGIVAGLAGLGWLVAGISGWAAYAASRSSAEDRDRWRAEQAALGDEIAELRESMLASLDALRRERRALDEWPSSVDRSGAAGDPTSAVPRDGRVPVVPVEASAERGPGRALLRDFEKLAGKPKENAVKLLADLAQMGDREALEKVLGALHDADPEIREEAVEAIADQEDPALATRLEPLMADPDPDVRREVASALGGLAGPRSGTLLLTLVSDSDPRVVQESIRALGRLRHGAAQPALLALVSSPDPEIIASAGRALMELGDEDGALVALANVATGLESSSERERVKAVNGIRRIGGSAATSYLEAALQDPSELVRQAAERALGRGDRR